MKRGIRLGLATTAVFAALGASGNAYAATLSSPAASATAAPAPLSLADLRIKALGEIQMRLDQINKLTDAINKSTFITADHKQTLLGILGRDQTGLTALKQDVTDATTAAQIHTDMQQMVDNYRIYVLATPQVFDVLAADREASATASPAASATATPTV